MNVKSPFWIKSSVFIVHFSLFRACSLKKLFSGSCIPSTGFCVALRARMHRFDWPSSIAWDDLQCVQLVCGFPEAAKPVLVAVYIETLHQNVLIPIIYWLKVKVWIGLHLCLDLDHDLPNSSLWSWGLPYCSLPIGSTLWFRLKYLKYRLLWNLVQIFKILWGLKP